MDTKLKFRRSKAALLGLAIAAAFATLPSQAATITVTTTADNALTDSTACTLRQAIVAADTNTATGGCPAGEAAPIVDTISVPAGTYTLSLGGPDYVLNNVTSPTTQCTTAPTLTPITTGPLAGVGDLDITESVNIVGAGSGQTIIQWASDATEPDRVFQVNSQLPTDVVTINAAFSGMTIAGGKTVATQLCLSPNVSADGTTPMQYWLRRGGAGVAVGAGDVIVEVDPTLSGSESGSSGSTGGSHQGGSGGSEGETTGPTLSASMNDVIVSGNSAGGDGGGIWTASPFSATNVVVQNNTSTTNGGGMYNEAATSIANSTFSGNTAEGGGGFFTTGSNSVTITGSTFANNTGVGGGAIATRPVSALKITNSTFYHNVGSDVGGGLYAGYSMDVKFATIANNLAGGDSPGAGAGINTFGSGSVSLQDTILGYNASGYDATTGDTSALIPANCGGTGSSGTAITSLGHNVFSDATCPTATGDLASTDPKIETLGSFGGTTQTMALLAGSPAINAGVAVAGITTDQRGVTRDPTPDVGAYEVAGSYTGTSSTSDGGGGGGGCTVGGDGAVDPTLIGALLAALSMLGLRRRRARKA